MESLNRTTPPRHAAVPQVHGLSALGVRAAALTSLTSKEDAAAISKQASTALWSLHVVTPLA